VTQRSARQRALARLLLMCGAVGAGGVAACTKVGSDPNAPVAIELRPTPLPSIVVGDSMRDSTGAVVPLRALVFNSSNDTIPGAPVNFLIISSQQAITLNPSTGAIVAGADTGHDSVVASVGSLQSAPINVVVVQPPDTLFAASSTLDSLLAATPSSKVLLPLTVKLGHHVAPDTVIPVPSYLVHYSFEHSPPPGYTNTDSSQVVLVDDSACPGSVYRCMSLVDTTDATGTSQRSVQLAPYTTSFPTPPDSLIIRADAFQYAAPTTPVPGSPVRFIVRFKPPTTSSATHTH
jgi:hypothetical protein